MTILVEACVDSVASAVAAERGGAGRLELCDNLVEGGTTPSAGMIAAVKAAVRIPVFVLVRPRAGAFAYSDVELDVMRMDIEAARMLGADGIVTGALADDGSVQHGHVHTLLDAAGGLPLTFHRAFDRTPDPARALEVLMGLRVHRVLTSGGAPTALDGVTMLAALVKRAAGAITVMAGGGLREDHVQEVVHRSRVAEVHVRGTSTVRRGPAVRGGPRFRRVPPEDENAWEETEERRIREFVRLANG